MKIFGCILALFLLMTHSWASQESQVREANELFKKQQWDKAIDLYKNALEQKKNADIIHYDLGTALYKKGDYDQSIEHLKKVLSGKDSKLSSKVYYNLGNALYKKGQTLENSNLDEAVRSMQESLVDYNKTSELNTKDEDAKYNHSVVEKEIERLNKKKQQQQSQQSQQSQNKQNSSSQSNQQNKENSQNKEPPQQPLKDNQSNQEDQKGQDQQSNQAQSAKDREKSAQSKQNQNAISQQKDLEKAQAKEMLEDYQKEEEPKGLLNFKDRNQGEVHVEKDW
ncbi:MAG: tetratricopeptide repeat protein [Candidatus Omnitrophota bacterium]